MEDERKPNAMWADEFGIVTGYMCLTDFECELGGASGGNCILPSLDDFKKARPSCARECGIVEVKVYGVRVVQEPAEIER